jgi:hypothetical protein
MKKSAVGSDFVRSDEIVDARNFARTKADTALLDQPTRRTFRDGKSCRDQKIHRLESRRERNRRDGVGRYEIAAATAKCGARRVLRPVRGYFSVNDCGHLKGQDLL